MKRFFLKFVFMRTRYLLILFAAVTLGGHAQQREETPEPYREDQFYMGITYNILLDLPNGVSQNNLSYGLQGGFIRDIPLNPECTFAIGIGLGYGVNSYYSNLRAIEENGDFRYEYLDDADYRRNKVETHLIEVPLEFRWRTSTRESYKFWRITEGLNSDISWAPVPSLYRIPM